MLLCNKYVNHVLFGGQVEQYARLGVLTIRIAGEDARHNASVTSEEVPSLDLELGVLQNPGGDDRKSYLN